MEIIKPGDKSGREPGMRAIRHTPRARAGAAGTVLDSLGFIQPARLVSSRRSGRRVCRVSNSLRGNSMKLASNRKRRYHHLNILSETVKLRTYGCTPRGSEPQVGPGARSSPGRSALTTN
ncbi:hypothetical protein EVAR_9367_1 [Eumeta japonica]|uniref:Uncharacterized protein n=1 Tax=Eumeta variegata TaxID=151549 RepID=A0A4C1YUM3_EUMVA|nr:hypothetical protein EVAR_9367_1 [Eumeta japonica]